MRWCLSRPSSHYRHQWLMRSFDLLWLKSFAPRWWWSRQKVAGSASQTCIEAARTRGRIRPARWGRCEERVDVAAGRWVGAGA